MRSYKNGLMNIYHMDLKNNHKEVGMKQKMWSLINTTTGKIIKIGIYDDAYVLGFDTKKELLEWTGTVEHDEEIRKIVFEH